ncbi:neuropeptide-like protein 31 [Drosophila albomicans]|uniref:Neuropeptide-like protein 31 n=1 Tax=Drosophila albomicans TaxID=7291 RepID=A0A6P8XJI8_DROAB|nr:neuropeptide-like protein 31 [Drosophila albomicans]
MKVPTLLIFIGLLASCLESSNALFFKALKGLKSYGDNYAGYSSYAGSGGYGNYYGGGGYGNYGSGGYGGYDGSYGSGGYGGGYSGSYSRPTRSRQRTGRTYSDIARVLVQDRYLGLGAGRYLPRAPYSPLWG